MNRNLCTKKAKSISFDLNVYRRKSVKVQDLTYKLSVKVDDSPLKNISTDCFCAKLTQPNSTFQTNALHTQLAAGSASHPEMR